MHGDVHSVRGARATASRMLRVARKEAPSKRALGAEDNRGTDVILHTNQL